jgi:signal transduction histidine kinase
MVVSFKQVAVDQTSEQRRNFDLRAVIEDNLSAMLPLFKKGQVKVSNLVPDGIQCNSFPGPLGQILTNIVQNAILHGFGETGSGTLTIQARDQRYDVIVSIRDDGVGMPSNVLAHIFDPFFTTRLGRGGSGLGLSISHRIATSVLGGNLAAQSTPDQGSTFFITIPKTAPFPI